MVKMVGELIVHLDKCSGCHICELACSATKNRAFGPRRARITVKTIEPGIIDLVTVCLQCSDPACMKICPVNAIRKDENTGIVLIDEGKCTGCGLCTKVCPVGAIKLDPKTRKAIKCDLCLGDPVCVKWCPTGALEYIVR
jgi:Fe-S-cluster-containing hydrogenase component 2